MLNLIKRNDLLKVSVFLLVFSLALFSFKAIQSILLLSSIVMLIFILKDYKVNKIMFFAPNIILVSLLFIIFITQINSNSFELFLQAIMMFISPIFCIKLYREEIFLKYYNSILLFITIIISVVCLIIIFLYFLDIKNHKYDWYVARYILEKDLKIHGTYIGMLITISLLIFYKNLLKVYNKSVFIYLIPLIQIIVLIIFNSRSSIYLTISIFLIDFFIVSRKNKQNRFKISTILFVSGLITMILVLSGRFMEDFKNIISQTSNSIRFVIYNCSIDYIKESILFGYPVNEVQNLLNTCYLESGNVDLLNLMASNKVNSHNQFLEYFLKGGVFTFIAFILVQFFKIYQSIKTKQVLYCYISIVFFSLFMIESLLTRQVGIYTYTVFEILFLGALFEQNANDKVK